MQLFLYCQIIRKKVSLWTRFSVIVMDMIVVMAHIAAAACS
jgi:hypothetical protein